jgi:hypothetical protein
MAQPPQVFFLVLGQFVVWHAGIIGALVAGFRAKWRVNRGAPAFADLACRRPRHPGLLP